MSTQIVWLVAGMFLGACGVLVLWALSLDWRKG